MTEHPDLDQMQDLEDQAYSDLVYQEEQMAENTALAIYKDFDGLQRAALALFKSGYFKDAKSEAQAVVKVMAGSELGLPPFASMTGIHIIQGKPTLGSNVIATLVKNDPRYDYRITKADKTACVLAWYENGEKVGTSEFTIAEAQDAGLTGKDNWKKYTSDMLFARAVSRGARRHAPGIFGGSVVYTPEEMGVIVDVVVEDITEEDGSRNLAIFDLLVEEGLSENIHSAKNALNLCSTGYEDPKDAIIWMKKYRGFRDIGAEPQQAADKTNNGETL